MSEALVHYRRALQLAQHDADLEHTVGKIQQQVEPVGPTASAPAQQQVAIEDIFDFDSLVAQLGTAFAAARAGGAARGRRCRASSTPSSCGRTIRTPLR